MRPTARGLVTLALGGLLVLLGGGFDYFPLTMLGIGLVVLFIFDLCGSLIGRAALALDRRKKRKQTTQTDASGREKNPWFKRLLLPYRWETTEQWEQRDQNDDIVRTIDGPAPHTRGIFHRSGTLVRWNGPFGLWKSTARTGDEATTVHPAHSYGDSESSLTSSEVRRPRGMGHDDEDTASSVRPYSPGDPERLISWTMSAHRGEMMTRVADSHQQPQFLIIVDTLTPAQVIASADDSDEATHTSEAAAFESLVGYVTRLFELRRPMDATLLITDGHALAETEQETAHFLAAVQPSTRGTAAERAEFIDSLLSEPNMRGLFVTSADSERGDFESELENAGVLRFMEIARVESDDEGAGGSDRESFSEGEHDGGQEHARKREADSHGGPGDSDGNDRRRTRRGNRPDRSDRSGHRGFRLHRQYNHRRRRLWTERSRVPSRASRVLTAAWRIAAIGFLLVAALVQLTTLFGSVAWLPFSITLAAVVAVEGGSHFSKTVRRTLLRLVIVDLVIAVAAAVTVSVALHQETGVWWFAPLRDVVVDSSGALSAQTSAASTAVLFLSNWGATTPFGVIGTVVSRGFTALMYQSFPVSASVYVDVTMILAVSLAMMAIRALIAVPALQPFCAAAPLIVMILRIEYFSAAQQTALIAGIVGATLVLLWASRRVPMPWPEPVVWGAAATAVAILLAPMVHAAVVSRIDLTHGQQNGLFSSSSVNPLVDLSRNLRGNSDSVALTYVSNDRQPRYLKMASLDDFDGDTWSFDTSVMHNEYESASTSGSESNSTDADQTAETSEPGGYGIDRTFSDGSPLMQYLSDVDFSSPSSSRGPETFTKVSIETLTSRFMPTTGLTSIVTPSDSEWYWSKDGVVYSQDAQVSSKDSYWLASAYIAPLSRRSEMATTVANLQRNLKASDESDTGSSESSGQQDDFLTLQSMKTANYVHANYTTVPKDLPKSVQKVVEAATTTGLTTSTEKTTEQQEQALGYLLDYFSADDFTYSLDAPDGNGRSNMEIIGDFLERKTGYCVHYATAFAVLARALGVSTRVVMGYIGKNDASSAETGKYTVTNQQLHAWVEAYVDTLGWIPFDVTPASEATEDTATDSSSAATDTTNERENDSSDTTDDSSTDNSGDDSDTDSADTDEDTDSTTDDTAATTQTSVLSDAARKGLGIAGAVILAVGMALTPFLVRRRRRRLRLRGVTGESAPRAADRRGRTSPWLLAWHEILDTALDHGIVIPTNATEERSARIVEEALRTTDDGTTQPEQSEQPEREQSGITEPSSASAAEALQTIARHVESSRYGAHPEQGHGSHADHDDHALVGERNSGQTSDAAAALRTVLAAVGSRDWSLRVPAGWRGFGRRLTRVKRALFPASVLRPKKRVK